MQPRYNSINDPEDSLATKSGMGLYKNQKRNFDEYLQFENGNKCSRFVMIAFATFLVILLTLYTLGGAWASLGDEQLFVRLYTHNIRYDNPNLVPGERRWSERKVPVSKSIKFYTEQPGFLSVVGLQEVLHNQLEDIISELNGGNSDGDWTYYGVGREDGKEKGEFAPILFRKLQWELIGNRTFWLSETPDVPSVGWDDELERIVSMVTLKHKQYTVNFFNTHFDHVGVVGRNQLAVLIADRMENYNKFPSFLTGDFNSEPSSAPYQYLKEHGFKDSRTLTPDALKYGYNATYTLFDEIHEADSIIDYIWAPAYATAVGTSKKLPSITVHSYGVLHSHFGFYMSDHRPVTALYSIKL